MLQFDQNFKHLTTTQRFQPWSGFLNSFNHFSLFTWVMLFNIVIICILFNVNVLFKNVKNCYYWLYDNLLLKMTLWGRNVQQIGIYITSKPMDYILTWIKLNYLQITLQHLENRSIIEPLFYYNYLDFIII